MNPFVDITFEPKSPAMKLGLELASVPVRGGIHVSLKKSSADFSAKTAKFLVIDESGSTTEPAYAMAGGKLIFPVQIAAAKKLVYEMNDGDMLGIITFSSNELDPSIPAARVIMSLTECTTEGREQLVLALSRIVPTNGGTDYVAGLTLAFEHLQTVTGMNRGIDFMSDGGCNPKFDPQVIAKQIRDAGIVLCTAGIHDQMSGTDEERLKAMSGGANYKQCLTADEVKKFLAGALRKTQNAALTNVRLEFDFKDKGGRSDRQPITVVQKINVFDRATRNGKRSHLPGTLGSPAVVDLDQLGPDETLSAWLECMVLPAKPEEPGEKQVDWKLGELVVFGACPSQGITAPVEMGRAEIVQNFALQTSGKNNTNLERLEVEWISGSATTSGSQTTDSGKQQQIFDAAAAKIRKTQVFADDDDVKAQVTDLESLRDESRAKGAAAASKSAGRKTAVFVDED